MANAALVIVVLSVPVVPALLRVKTSTRLERFCTTYRSQPSSSRPSPLITEVPPQVDLVAAPVLRVHLEQRPVFRLHDQQRLAVRRGGDALRF